jgi:hypothetical protein
VQLVSQLEQIELVGDPPLLVREKREIGADARAKGSVDVGLVDGRHGDAPILPLELVLGVDEVASRTCSFGHHQLRTNASTSGCCRAITSSESSLPVCSGRLMSGNWFPTTRSSLIVSPLWLGQSR